MGTVTLSIKHVPADMAERLRTRAARNHRSLQGELMAILDEASRVLTIEDLAAFAERVGLRTSSNSATLIRQDRDCSRR